MRHPAAAAKRPGHGRFGDLFARAAARRKTLAAAPRVTAYRLFDGTGDGLAGVYVDRYGPAATLAVADDSGWAEEQVTSAATAILETMRPAGLEAVYVKRFSKDRSRLGGRAPEESYSATPRAGEPQPETLVVEEHGVRFEVRPYDGFSTGLFLEHRDHRRALARLGARRVLNLFAYTCGFSVPLVAAGAHVTNVDVSSRYLDWGRRNHALNGLGDGETEKVRYSRMDALAYLAYASRHLEERYDLIILDPPTFAAGDKRRGVEPWKATADYPKLLQAADRVLRPGGSIFAATNARELAADGALKALVQESIGKVGVEWEKLPPWPADMRERGRVAAVLFSLR